MEQTEAVSRATEVGGVILSFIVAYGIWVLVLALIIFLFIYFAAFREDKGPPPQ